MHSSRMRTVHLLPVSPSMHCAGGVSAPGGVSRGCLLWSGGCVSQHAMGQTPPWTEFLTHASENITLSQLRCGQEKMCNWLHICIELHRKSHKYQMSHICKPSRSLKTVHTSCLRLGFLFKKVMNNKSQTRYFSFW